jgi:uncharacterized repeat protein (TIGR03806 family)
MNSGFLLKNRWKAALFGLSVVVLFSSCNISVEKCRDGVKSPCIPTEEPHKRLSNYNLYQGELRELNPVSGLLPYDLNTRLFSDYAQKQRFLYVPEDSAIAYDTDGVLDFPIGSMLVKNFYYDLDRRDESSKRLILETRLLIHRETGWTAQTYVWNEEQDEAFLELAGAQKDVSWINENGITRNVNFLIPTQNDCKTCHSKNGKLLPLGPKVRNLNGTYPYSEGVQNQLMKWEQAGILQGKPALQSVPRVPVWDDPSTGSLNQRVRIYLDVNCANCHNRGGSANNSGLFLSYDEKNARSFGINKPPVAAGRGSGGLQYDILPGHPDKSILVYRMESVHPAIRMPELGRTLVHEKAVALIREWIQKMEEGEFKSMNK